MYKFIDLNKAQTDATYLPSVAMEIDGLFIEDEIIGYRTLTVEGRESYSTKVNEVVGVSGLDGSIFLSETIPNREFQVRFSIEAKDSEEFQLKFNRLKAILKNKRNVIRKVSFKDDIEYYYNALMIGIEDVEPISNNTTGTILIRTTDPFKYSKTLRQASGPYILMKAQQEYGRIILEEIKTTLTNPASSFTVTNTVTGDQLKLLGPFQAGDEIKINFLKATIKLNGIQNILNRLVFESSRFTDFYVNDGDIIAASVGTINCSWRERSL